MSLIFMQVVAISTVGFYILFGSVPLYSISIHTLTLGTLPVFDNYE